MDDLISRQAAIDAIYEMHVYGEKGVKKALPNTYGADLREIVEQIEDLPSAQSERTGQWIRHSIGHENMPWGYDCSACGTWFVIGDDTAERYHFCPNCGADMRKEKTDEH